jgi:transcriptional regulator with XRE-family HTH domain
MVIEIGHNIQAARKRANLTQAELAHKVGISARHLQRIEKGQIDRLSIFDLDTIASALGLESLDLMPTRPRTNGNGQSLLNSRPDDPEFNLTEQGEKSLRAGLEIAMRFSRASRDRQLIVQCLLWQDPTLLLKLSADGRALLNQLAGVRTPNQKSKNRPS